VGAAAAAEQIQNLSYATGMTVERVQALNRIGKEKGLGDLTGSIEKLNVQLGKGEGGPFTEAILRANINPKAGADALYYLEELRKKYAQIPNETERAQKATADLGRRLLDLLPIVLNDRESIADMVAELENSSVVMKGPAIEALLELNDEIHKHGRAWEEVKNKAKEYAGEITLAFLKAVEAAKNIGTPSSPEEWRQWAGEGEWTADQGRKWTGSSGVIGKDAKPPQDILGQRAKDQVCGHSGSAESGFYRDAAIQSQRIRGPFRRPTLTSGHPWAESKRDRRSRCDCGRHETGAAPSDHASERA
jgi:hypothetical protein